MALYHKAMASDEQATGALWWAGLAAWRQKQYELSAKIFTQMAENEVEGASKDAAIFWASRAWLRAQIPQEAARISKWIKPTSRSFYGLLGLYATGRKPLFTWHNDKTQTMHQYDMGLSGELNQVGFVKRAMALKQIGQDALAIKTLFSRLGEFDSQYLYQLLWQASQLQDAYLAYQIGMQLQYRDLPVPDDARYPLISWNASFGHQVDRALLHAFIRQESRFNPQARSRSGAMGLMQLMPSTARYISHITDFPLHNSKAAYHPNINLALGQLYLRYLMQQAEIQGNLFYVSVGYNAGPGNLQRWRERFEYQDDPLLFIETLPSLETRNYVEAVMANLWIYRYRLGQPVPSLIHLLQASWPIYVNLENRHINVNPL